MIGILDVDLGNIRSVANAIYSIGYDYQIVREPDRIDQVSHLILPGVGSYYTAMDNLKRLNLFTKVREFAAAGRPVLGLCLGMQLLSGFGEEGGGAEGLGLIPGKVMRLECEPLLPLPHVGWNTLNIVRDHPVFYRVKSQVDFYFVHSYGFQCQDDESVLAVTDYGLPVTAVVGKGNVLGFQFHPEKSQGNGLRLLENFCDWDGN